MPSATIVFIGFSVAVLVMIIIVYRFVWTSKGNKTSTSSVEVEKKEQQSDILFDSVKGECKVYTFSSEDGSFPPIISSDPSVLSSTPSVDEKNYNPGPGNCIDSDQLQFEDAKYKCDGASCEDFSGNKYIRGETFISPRPCGKSIGRCVNDLQLISLDYHDAPLEMNVCLSADQDDTMSVKPCNPGDSKQLFRVLRYLPLGKNESSHGPYVTFYSRLRNKCIDVNPADNDKVFLNECSSVANGGITWYLVPPIPKFSGEDKSAPQQIGFTTNITQSFPSTSKLVRGLIDKGLNVITSTGSIRRYYEFKTPTTPTVDSWRSSSSAQLIPYTISDTFQNIPFSSGNGTNRVL